jgi:dihydroorotate dehydrogenase
LLYDAILKPALFQLAPETAHELAVQVIRQPLLGSMFLCGPRLSDSQNALLKADFQGIPLDNPMGLAAGFDKNGIMYPQLHRMGFGFVEIGTVTAKSQQGNPKPRLFRLPKDKALINRMGFNNDGADVIADRLSKQKASTPLGGNIGKSKVTPLEDAVSDYVYSFNKLKPFVDYFVVNVSSPNTPGLRKLQDKGPLLEILTELQGLNRDPKLPILLKIAPDLNESQLEDIVAVVEESQLSGVIATNTTIGREGLKTRPEEIERMGAGGLSGAPITNRATEVIRFLKPRLPKDVTLIGVGGIMSGQDAYDKLKAGADLLQIYTGLIYLGPDAVKQIIEELVALLERDGVNHFTEIIGTN